MKRNANILRSAPTEAMGAGHVPVDEYETFDTSNYIPTAADMAVTKEDYDMTDAQLDFEIRKASKAGDEDRVTGLKVVKSMRVTTEKQRAKQRRGDGKHSGFVTDWLKE